MHTNAPRPTALLHRRMAHHVARWLCCACVGSGAALASASPALAWDPSTTHAGMVSRALTESALHLRWMEGSELSRGLFSALRVDPAQLDDDLRRRIELAQRRAHADSGARSLGGPGACPGATAPASTRARCVEGDQWEATALGWVTLGLIAEVTPRERILHHFSDPQDPGANTWHGSRLPKALFRATQRRNGGPRLAALTGTAFRGTATSAAAWLDDPDDPWAPPAMFEHLRQASLLRDGAARRHHLALGLMGLGALLHVVQDATVPAHARADMLAFVAPLSDIPGDHGLPLAEYARLMHGRAALPHPVALPPRPTPARRGVLRAKTLRGHLLGGQHADQEGVAVRAGSRFLSEGTLPAPMRIDPKQSAEHAAAALLADANLSPAETAGARLSPWPAAEGYVLSTHGRPLAAFATDDLDRVRLQLDRRVYRDQVGHLIPLAIDASRSIVDLVFPAWPTTAHAPGGDVLELDATHLPGKKPKLHVLIEDAAGDRRVHRVVQLNPGARNRLLGAIPTLAPGERVVLVVRSTIGAHRLTTESLLTRPALADPNSSGLSPKLHPGPHTLAPEVGSVQPPTDGTVQPPTDGTVQPPTDGTVQPPTDGTVQPPTDGTAQPPTDGTAQPPTDGTAQPPTDGATDGTVQPGAEGPPGAGQQQPPNTVVPGSGAATPGDPSAPPDAAKVLEGTSPGAVPTPIKAS